MGPKKKRVDAQIARRRKVSNVVVNRKRIRTDKTSEVEHSTSPTSPRPTYGRSIEEEEYAHGGDEIEQFDFDERLARHPGDDVDMEFLLVPSEAKLVYVSQDGKELHYIVPMQQERTYHTRKRDFIVVGFRIVHCSNRLHANTGSENDVVVGWCNGVRHCREPPFRRETYPGADMDFSADQTGFGALCPCAKRLFEFLGGHQTIRLNMLMHHGQEVYYPTDGKARTTDWRVAGNDYAIVNLNKPYDLVFNQWGVSKKTCDGFSCKICTSQPRHCAHNKALLGIDTNESSFSGNTLSPKEVAETSISKMLDEETKMMKPPCISRHELPFFPHEDEDVDQHNEGRSTILLIIIYLVCVDIASFFIVVFFNVPVRTGPFKRALRDAF